MQIALRLLPLQLVLTPHTAASMRCFLVLVASAAALRPSNAPLPLVEKSRRAFGAAAVAGAFVALPANAKIDVNNAMAREFTAFPGLYPTIATKIVNSAKDVPFKSKRDVYAILNEMEKERLKQYDKSIIISAPDKSLQQFKTSQICKYECGGRTSSSYRDEQIKSIQRARQQDY